MTASATEPLAPRPARCRTDVFRSLAELPITFTGTRPTRPGLARATAGQA